MSWVPHPGEDWHVGDSLTSDVAGARNAGLAEAIWLDRAGNAGSHHGHRITSLAELPAF